jgi:DNA-binding transcriptional LysR family regulator
MRPPFDLNLMRLLVALYEDRSVTRAAQRLGISQPSVSNGLRKLRGQFGDQLFVRSASGMEPTPRAHAIAGGWKDVIERVGQDLVANTPFDPAGATLR